MPTLFDSLDQYVRDDIARMVHQMAMKEVCHEIDEREITRKQYENSYHRDVPGGRDRVLLRRTHRMATYHEMRPEPDRFSTTYQVYPNPPVIINGWTVYPNRQDCNHRVYRGDDDRDYGETFYRRHDLCRLLLRLILLQHHSYLRPSLIPRPYPPPEM